MLIEGTPPPPRWRPMTLHDIPGLMAVADQVHPDLPEDAAVFAERATLFPTGCRILEDANSGKVIGYFISHPIRENEPPNLGAMLGSIPADAKQYYIHDVAILPSARGHGSAAQCIKEMLTPLSRAYPTSALVSVYGTSRFWEKYGFETDYSKEDDVAFVKKLQNYGVDAIYMVRQNGQLI